MTSFATGLVQSPSEGTDILYVQAPVIGGSSASVTVGEFLNQAGAGFSDLPQNRIVFTNVSNVVAAVSNFAGFGTVGYAFALTPSGSVTTNLCIYAGTGAQPPSLRYPTGQGSSYDTGSSPGSYPPVSGKSGCTTLATSPALAAASFGYIASFPFKIGGAPQLLVEDTSNAIIYVLTVGTSGGSNGLLPGVATTNHIQLPPSDGAGPTYTADLNGDGNTDLIVNNQTGLAATIYLGNGDGTFQSPQRVTFGERIHSILLADMDADGVLDLVAEVDGGVIEIHKGNGNGTFQNASEGGTIVDANNGLEGNGGHLALIADLNHDGLPDILTTTPIGMSVLINQSRLKFKLTNIYNIGPGRNSLAVADFRLTGNLDIAIDSAEGIAIANGNGDGTFQTSHAYAALAPALSATAGIFRNTSINPSHAPDMVVSTAATNGQLLLNDGTGEFTAAAGVTNTGPQPTTIPAGVWSSVSMGDFNADGNQDILYTLAGMPSTPAIAGDPYVYIQFGKGDGTFLPAPSGAMILSPTSSPAQSFYYPGSAVGNFNTDSATDFALDLVQQNIAWLTSPSTYQTANFNQPSVTSGFNVVAAGYFKTGRTPQQDIIFQQGTTFVPHVNNQDGTGKNYTTTTALTGLTAPFYPTQALLTDVDGDGNGDLVVFYYNTVFGTAGNASAGGNSVGIWYGNGDGTFIAPIFYQYSRNYYLGAIADMNGDGLNDLVMSDGSLVSIVYNLGGSGATKHRLFGNEEHFLAGQGINSLIVADVNGDGTPDIVAANGGVTISNPVAMGGETAASLALNPNPDVNTGGITVLLNHIATTPVTMALTTTPEPSVLQAAFTLTATVTPGIAGNPLPTGVVQFSIDGLTVGSAITVVPGTTSSTATYIVPAGNTYTSGTHTISATYSGDAVNSPAVVSATHAIQSGATTTTLYLCIGPSPTCPSSGFVVAPPPPYPSSLSMYFGQGYNGVLGTTANDGSTLSSASIIDFNDNYMGVNTTLCTEVVGTGGQCQPSVGDPGTTQSGVHVFTGFYTGDATHATSTSTPVTINVSPDLTTATLSGAANPSPLGQAVTLTATVSGNFAAPVGPVTFTYGAATLGTANLVPGSGLNSTATLSTTALPLGADIVTANYAATLNFNAASAQFTETITPSLAGSFTISVAPSPATVGVGYSTLFVVTVTPQGGFVQGVNLTCANLPTEATCLFDNASIAAGGGTTNLVVATTAPHSCGTTTPYFLGSNDGGSSLAPVALPALAGLAMLFLPGRRRWLRSLIALVAVAAAMQMTGCGTCTDLGTRPATYTFQVVGTASSSGTTAAQNVTLTVAI